MFKKNKKQTENVKEKKVRTVKVGTHKKTVIVLHKDSNWKIVENAR